MNVFSFCRRCSWIISWLDSYIFISDATAPKMLMLAFCRQSHMQEPRPARPECPACSRAPGSGQWVWERGSGGAHTARRAGGWFGPFLCLLRKKEGKKKSSFRNKPHYKQHSRMHFYRIRTRGSLAARAFSALDTRLLTKRSRVASAPCPAPTPVSAPTTAGEMPRPEEDSRTTGNPLAMLLWVPRWRGEEVPGCGAVSLPLTPSGSPPSTGCNGLWLEAFGTPQHPARV